MFEMCAESKGCRPLHSVLSNLCSAPLPSGDDDEFWTEKTDGNKTELQQYKVSNAVDSTPTSSWLNLAPDFCSTTLPSGDDVFLLK